MDPKQIKIKIEINGEKKPKSCLEAKSIKMPEMEIQREYAATVLSCHCECSESQMTTKFNKLRSQL